MPRDRGFFTTVNYSSQNEDWRTEATALDLHDGQHILVITGSGDRALNPLAAADVRVVAVDCNPAQNHLLRIKMAALRTFYYTDYASFIGLTEGDSSARRRQAAELDLPVATRAWLDMHDADVASGLLYCGRFERWFRRAASVGNLVMGPTLRELFELRDLEAQRALLRARWDRPAWRGVWLALCHPLIARLFFGDPAFYVGLDGSVGGILFDRMRLGLDRVLARESFMAHLVLRGRLSPADLPPYLDERWTPTIRDRLDRIHIVDGDVMDVLADHQQAFDGLSLSDLPSFLDAARLQQLLEHARDATRPGGRIVLRWFLRRFEPPTVSGLRRLPELERELAVSDRTFSYAFTIFEVDNGLRR